MSSARRRTRRQRRSLRQHDANKAHLGWNVRRMKKRRNRHYRVIGGNDE